MRPTMYILAIGAILTACARLAAPPPAPDADPAASASTPPRNTQHVTRAARSGQHRFERLRRWHFPLGALTTSGRCDEVIGRFCLWHDDRDERWTPQPEADAVRHARARLLDELERASASAPLDPWVAGQQVRYLAEAGRHDEAVAAARACRAVPDWWCLALEGFALHGAARVPDADSAFARALAAMPERERCRWTDIAVLLDDRRARAAYARTPCAARDSVERRFWWLADPLYLMPGNDHRTEHYSRLVLDALQLRAESGFGLRWGEDLRELLLRFGWPAGWDRAPRRPGALEDGPVIGHHARGARTFAPPVAALERPTAFTPADWPLDPARPRSAHLPPYAVAFDALAHQLAVFRRGDSAVVVVAYDAGDSLPAGTAVDVAVALARDAWSPPLLVRSASDTPRGSVSATVASVPVLLSAEVLARSERRAARARYGLALEPLPPGTFAISDVLLFAPGDSLPDSLAAAATDALGALRVRSGGRVGVYWEVYGLSATADPIAVTVALVREGKSWLRQAFEWIGVARDRSRRAHLAWTEQPRTGAAILPRAVSLDLVDLEPGDYRLTVEARRAGGDVARAERIVVVQ